jgi:hypothetical protein
MIDPSVDLTNTHNLSLLQRKAYNTNLQRYNSQHTHTHTYFYIRFVFTFFSVNFTLM